MDLRRLSERTQERASDDDGLEGLLGLLHVDIGLILALNLLRSVVDEDVCGRFVSIACERKAERDGT